MAQRPGDGQKKSPRQPVREGVRLSSTLSSRLVLGVAALLVVGCVLNSGRDTDLSSGRSDISRCRFRLGDELLIGGAELAVLDTVIRSRQLRGRRGEKFTGAEMEMEREAASDETIEVDKTESAVRKYRNTLPPSHPNTVPPQGRVGTARYPAMTAVRSYPLNGDDLVPHWPVVRSRAPPKT
uniref:Uncharacterized protein n=1 Tax=Oryza meridionalis TaxID=40149 RepID=A0A0E0E8B3_9ORYZ